MNDGGCGGRRGCSDKERVSGALRALRGASRPIYEMQCPPKGFFSATCYIFQPHALLPVPLHPFLHVVALLPAIHHPHYHHFISPHQTSIFYTLLPICDSLPQSCFRSSLHLHIGCCHHGCVSIQGLKPSLVGFRATGAKPRPAFTETKLDGSHSVYFLVASLLSPTAG